MRFLVGFVIMAAFAAASISPIAVGAQAGVRVRCGFSVATIVGTSGDDRLVGTSGDDVIAGLGGNDRIIGLEGNDVLCGGDGDDVIRGGGGNDLLLGGAGSDRLRGMRGDDVILGDSGTDWLWGAAGSDLLVGGSGRDRLRGNAGADVLAAAGGRDQLRGGSQRDVLLGGFRGSSCVGGSGRDVARQCSRLRTVEEAVAEPPTVVPLEFDETNTNATVKLAGLTDDKGGLYVDGGPTDWFAFSIAATDVLGEPKTTFTLDSRAFGFFRTEINSSDAACAYGYRTIENGWPSRIPSAASSYLNLSEPTCIDAVGQPVQQRVFDEQFVFAGLWEDQNGPPEIGGPAPVCTVFWNTPLYQGHLPGGTIHLDTTNEQIGQVPGGVPRWTADDYFPDQCLEAN